MQEDISVDPKEVIQELTRRLGDATTELIVNQIAVTKLQQENQSLRSRVAELTAQLEGN